MNEVLRLVNDEVNELVEKLKHFKDNLSTAVYEQFKRSFVLAKTEHLRGKTGDALKQYMEVVHFHLAEKIINIVHELHEAAVQMQAHFLDYEKDENGTVHLTAVEQSKRALNASKEAFAQLDMRSNQLLNRASEFIHTIALPSTSVTSAFTQVSNYMSEITIRLSEQDQKVANDLTKMKARVEQLFQQVNELSDHLRDRSGILNSNVESIKNQSWYITEKNGAFSQMLDDDPLIYFTNHSDPSEEQWIIGIDGDIYFANMGHAFGVDGYLEHDGFLVDAAGNFSAFKGLLQSQATDNQGEGNDSFNPYRMDMRGSVTAVQVEETYMLGNEEFHGYVFEKLDAFSAAEHMDVKIPEDVDDVFKFAIGGSVSGASAKAEAGLTLFGIEEAEATMNGDGEKSSQSLLGIDASVSSGFQASAGVEYSSETVFSSSFTNERTNALEVDLSAIIGTKIELQIPSLQLKWPW